MQRLTTKHLYHLADLTNLASIRKHGLLSTRELLKLARIPPREAERLLATHRTGPVTLANGIVIRDQIPMPPKALVRALPPGHNPADWYRLLNGFVFLWPDAGRLERHRNACPPDSQALLVFDAERLLTELGDRIVLSPINSGNARRKPAMRSRETLVPYRAWLEAGWPVIDGHTPRAASFQPAEVLVEGHVPLQPYLVEIR